MLLKNFRALINFYGDGTFTDVFGNTINKKNNIAANAWEQGAGLSGRNGLSSNSRYDYLSTARANNYTQETGLYTWQGILQDNAYQYDTREDGRAGYRKNGFVLFVGSGNTSVTQDDYKLDSALELQVTSSSCTHSSEVTYVQRTFANNTQSDITIREIGCYMFAQQGSVISDTTKMFPLIMIGRKVLDTPIVLPAGESRGITYNIDFRQITFAEADE